MTFLRLIIAVVLAPIFGFSVTAFAAKNLTLAELSTTQGYVYVNLPKDGSLPTELTIKEINQKKAIKLQLRSDIGIHAYGAWVPPGEYRFEKWNAFSWSDHDTFLVKAGAISDLGSVVPIPIGGYQFVPVPMRPAEAAGLVKNALTEFGQYISKDVLEWKPTALPKPIQSASPMSGLGLVADLLLAYERKVNKPRLSEQLRNITDINQFVAAAKTTMPPLYESGFRTDHGGLLFGADMGQIRVRGEDGTWSSIDTGTIWAVTALAIVDKTFYVGAGNLILSADANIDGSVWRRVVELPVGERISGLHRVETGWLVDTIVPANIRGSVSSIKQVRVYLSKGEDPVNLVLLKAVDVDPNKALDIYKGTQSEISHGYYFANAFSELIRINLDTLEVGSVPFPFTAHIVEVESSANTIVAYHAQGVFSKLAISTSAGMEWVEGKAPPYFVEKVNFQSPTEGYAVRANPGAFVVTRESLKFDRSKNSWTKIFEAPSGCVRLLNDGSGSQGLCVTNGGSILSRKDVDWLAEFSVE